MDDWALATVADLEDRTRIRGIGSTVSPNASRRRRRRAAASMGDYNPVGTVVRESASRQSSGTLAPTSNRMQALAWVLIACSVLVITLAAVATLVLIRANSTDIPVVTDISSTVTGEVIAFEWGDPGLGSADAYQVAVNGGGQSVQSQPTYTVDADPGDHVCLTVRVTRDGRLGDASNPKCVDIPG